MSDVSRKKSYTTPISTTGTSPLQLIIEVRIVLQSINVGSCCIDAIFALFESRMNIRSLPKV